MADPDTRQIFEETMPERLRANPGLAREIGERIHFRISGAGGGEWTLDCTGEDGEILPGLEGEPKMTVSSSATDFVQVSTGKLNANMAVMAGKLRLEPMDMGLALKLSKLI